MNKKNVTSAIIALLLPLIVMAEPRIGDRAEYRTNRLFSLNPMRPCGQADITIYKSKFSALDVKVLHGEGPYTHQFAYVREISGGSQIERISFTDYFPGKVLGPQGTKYAYNFKDSKALKDFCEQNGTLESIEVSAGTFLTCKVSSYDGFSKSWYRAGVPFGLVKAIKIESSCDRTEIEMESANR